MRFIRSEPHSSSAFSANTAREAEKEEAMGRRTLTLEDQLRGIRAALKSERTPPQLKPGLTKRKEFLEKSLGKERQRKNNSFWW
jgi:hypothetical protein